MGVSLSLDTVLTVIGLTEVVPVVVIAIVASGVLTAVMAELMACVFKCNRVCEVLGLFALLLVGIMLTSKTGHPVLFGCEVDFTGRVIFYFVSVTAMPTEVVQRCRLRKIWAQVTISSASHVAAAR